MTEILLAVPELAQEPALVAVASTCGVRIVRRCVDAVDLLAAAAVDDAAAVIVSAGVPRLSRDSVERIGVGNRAIVGLASDPGSARVLRGIGVQQVVSVGTSPETTLRALVAAIESGVEHLPVADVVDEPTDGGQRAGAGQVVAVWGPLGSPGRTTVAIGLAEAISAGGANTALVDADTYGPSVAMALGVVDDVSGLVVACRHADLGTLNPSVLQSVARSVRPNLHVISGLAGPSRWADVRSTALDRVWSTARQAFVATVVDVGFCIEDDAGDGTAWSRQRNAAAVGTLAAADQVIAVADGSALGAARLVEAWPRLLSVTGGREPRLVVNRAANGRLGRQWAAAVRSLGVGPALHVIPHDPDAAARAWQQARALGETRRKPGLRRSVRELAASVVSG